MDIFNYHSSKVKVGAQQNVSKGDTSTIINLCSKKGDKGEGGGQK